MNRSNSRPTLLLSIIACLLLLANIGLVVQNLRLRSKIDKLKPMSLEQNDVLGVFTARDTDGKETELAFSDNNKTILLFFNTKCLFCEQQMPLWKDLAFIAEEHGYQFVALTAETDTDAIKDYLREHGIEKWTVKLISSEEAMAAKLAGTPLTAVVDRAGVVERVWTGLWRERDLDSVNEYFATNLRQH